jgi:hypothetical protein
MTSIRRVIAHQWLEVQELMLTENEYIVLRHILATPTRQCYREAITNALDMKPEVVIEAMAELIRKEYIILDGILERKWLYIATKEIRASHKDT